MTEHANVWQRRIDIFKTKYARRFYPKPRKIEDRSQSCVLPVLSTPEGHRQSCTLIGNRFNKFVFIYLIQAIA